MKKTVYMPIGLPGCGKTTFGNNLSKQSSGKILSIGLDDIREYLYPGYSKGIIPFENMDIENILNITEKWCKDILNNKYDLWFDAVNVDPLHRKIAIKNFKNWADYIIAIDFHVPFDEILKRNKEQRNGFRKPPRKILEKMRSQKFQNPVSIDEGFNEILKYKWKNKNWVLRSCECLKQLPS